MKQIFYFLMLVTIPLQSALASHDDLDGKWVNDDWHINLSIKDTREGLKIKEKHDRRWQFLESIDWNTFRNRDNVIKVVDKHTLAMRKRGHRTTIFLFKKGKRGYNSCLVDPFEQYDFRGRSRFERGRDRDRFDDDYNVRNTIFDGIWYGQNSGVQMEIQKTSDGLRARDNSKSKWVYYSNTAVIDTYVDDRGNRLRYGRSGWIWQSKDGRRELSFTK